MQKQRCIYAKLSVILVTKEYYDNEDDIDETSHYDLEV